MKRLYHIPYIIWSILVTIVIIYICTSLPLEFAFETNPISGFIPSWLVNSIFILDLFINLGKIKKRNKYIQCDDIINKKWYQSTLIISDVIAAIPFDILIPIPFLKLLKLFKLARLHKSFMNLKHITIQYAVTITFISFAFWFIMTIHALACGWHDLQLHQHHPEFATDYINALYWTITTITTVGYGDITPVTNLQKIYAIMVQILGFGVFTFVIGTVASTLMRKDPAKVRYEENVDGLLSLMHYKSLPGPLRNKIMDFYKYMWRNRLGYDETAFLQSLPEKLHTEVALHLKKEVIETVSIFQNASSKFKREIALQLKPIFLTPGDYIFKAGDKAERMFFVVNGELNTLTQTEDRVLTHLQAGDFFGEIALFKNKNRSATVKSLCYCDLYSLDKTSFDNVISKYPNIGDRIKTTVESRENNYTV